ncbi:MAG: AAA family ATPase [Deltaproteobacteria bacterium]|nr:AAA family ATPase [Deltaproteobacteria bacterium]
MNSIDGASCFSWLLTKFSTPKELFGRISLAALQQDRVSRITTGKAPEAQVVFADEIFKSNSAVLNAMLTLVNERVFYNDGKAVPCPSSRWSGLRTSCRRASSWRLSSIGSS